jgi:hypothetical protein
VHNVELLFWEGCPSHPRALAELRAAMAELGLDPSTIVVREIQTQAEATKARFVGSPTIRIDGLDVRPPGEEPFGLTCRVYHRRDGRISPTPDPADVRDALAAAQAAARAKPPVQTAIERS